MTLRARARLAGVAALFSLLVVAAAARAAAAPEAEADAALDHLTWSADGSLLAGVRSTTRGRAVVAWRVADGSVAWSQPIAPAAEAERATVGDLVLAPSGRGFVLVLDGDLYAWRPGDAALRRLTDTPAAETWPGLSPSESEVAFARAGRLYVVDLATGAPRPVVDEGSPDPGLGLAPSPDGTVAPFGWSPVSDALYFFAAAPEGDDAATPGEAGLAVADLAWHSVQPLQRDGAPLRDPLRATWRFDGGAIAVERRSDDGGRLELLLCHPEKGYCVPLATQGRSGDRAVADSFRFLFTGFLWGQEVDGVRSLELYDTLGRARRRLLAPEWELIEVYGVDLASGRTTLRAVNRASGEPALLELDVAGGATRVLSRGDAEALAGPEAGAWVRGWRDDDGAPRRALIGADGAVLTPLPPAPAAAPVEVEDLP